MVANLSASQLAAMEAVKPSQKAYILEQAYRSSLSFRSAEPTNMKSAIYDVEMDMEDSASKYRSESQKKLLAEGVVVREGRRRRFWIACCCHMFFLTLILLLVAGILVVKLVPKDPRVQLGELRLTEFAYNSSSPTPGRPQIASGITGELTIANRNRFAEEMYREISLGFSYRDASLGEVSLPGFEQKTKATTSIPVTLKDRNTIIQNQADADSLKAEVAAANVQIQMTGKVKGTHKVLGAKVKKFDIDVRCVINVKPGTQSTQAQRLASSCYYDS